MAIMVPVFFLFPVCVVVGGLWSESEEERPLLQQSVVALSRIRKTSTYVGYNIVPLYH